LQQHSRVARIKSGVKRPLQQQHFPQHWAFITIMIRALNCTLYHIGVLQGSLYIEREKCTEIDQKVTPRRDASLFADDQKILQHIFPDAVGGDMMKRGVRQMCRATPYSFIPASLCTEKRH
jgi:hypothetical protein